MFNRRKTEVKKASEVIDRFIKKQIHLSRLPTRLSISKAFSHGREIAQGKRRSEAVKKAKKFLFGFLGK
jgi:hypothetical protein